MKLLLICCTIHVGVQDWGQLKFGEDEYEEARPERAAGEVGAVSIVDSC